MQTRIVYILLFFAAIWLFLDDFYGQRYISQFVARIVSEDVILADGSGGGGGFSEGGEGSGGGGFGGR